MRTIIQLAWLVIGIGLLQLTSILVLVLRFEAGYSRQALGAPVSFLIISAFPVLVAVRIARRLGRGFVLAPSHWGVPPALAPFASTSIQDVDFFEN